MTNELELGPEVSPLAKRYSNPNKGIWKVFFQLCVKARLPVVWIIVFGLVSMGSSQIYLFVPTKTGELLAGNVTVQIVTVVILSEILTNVIGQIAEFISDIVKARIDRNFRNVMWDKVLKLRPRFFDKIPAQSLISRITLDTEKLRIFIMDVVVSELLGIYVLYITLAQISEYDSRLSYMLLGLIPVVALLAFIFGRLFMKVSLKIQDRLSGLTQFLNELITVLPTIKTFNKEEREAERGKQVIQTLYGAERSHLFVSVLNYPFDHLLGLGKTLALIFMGIPLLKSGTLDVAGWYAFYMFATNLMNMVSNKGSQWETIKSTQGSLLRVSNILRDPEEGTAPYLKESTESGDIVFNKVNFGYDADSTVLKQATFIFPEGKTTAIVGPSGVGKTTVLKLLERLYEPHSGEITVKGTNIRDYEIRNWRREIGYLPQNVPLMSGTIKENLLFGLKREHSHEEIVATAMLANVHAMIVAMPDGYETQVGQFGSRLSGGQRQRIGIARTILLDPKYMILDEPTADLDAIATSDVLKGLESLQKDRTVIMVTHDQKAVKRADHVVVFHEDGTVSSGSYAEMLVGNLFFRHMMNGEEMRGDEHE
ncbi:ABC transporter ATP-binding protein [Bacillus sp. NSP9.1]|uniref:ABC transporter ATP-binding protein n=1 Tax=Bacillus sp. NSP9.1 TaxID=1071078 RepID=UPI0003FA71A7|nr:ABC transporter ATP-binding protein [Bacillus sp. NSP9.1]QHZ47126.1 ABC transporter ATP-binding protein [Bacillus sp. NSP9.1]